MAYPFGGHPTLGRYLIWARDTHGFSAQTGICSDEEGKTYTTTRIFKEGGASVIVSGLSQSDYLEPSMVGYLDRRLGVTSKFFSVDGDGAD